MDKYAIQYSPSFEVPLWEKEILCHFIWPLLISVTFLYVFFQTNISTLDLLPSICKYAHWENQNGHSGIYHKEEVYLRLVLLRSERLSHKCTEINASNFLYSFFFFLHLMEMFVLFKSLSFMKYNVLKTLCDDVIIFFRELFFSYLGFSLLLYFFS